ncbi:unnamed protein product [Schistosoma margrebowiei]|uniref:Uncharacterized protein n=1 Tax=Schistosoma margrebowiei TaxID=48269 RepID=A0A183LPT6_9TREM|nr:unnamed protein product [Schistosoma margrebowiei]
MDNRDPTPHNNWWAKSGDTSQPLAKSSKEANCDEPITYLSKFGTQTLATALRRTSSPLQLEKTFKVDRHGRVEVISIDHPKTTHVDDSPLLDNLRLNVRPIKLTSGIPTPTSDPALGASETSFSRSLQQHVSSALSTDETSVSRPDQQNTPPLNLDEIQVS